MRVFRRIGTSGRAAALAAAAAACLFVGSAETASAQGLFDAFFGRQPHYVRPPAPMSPQVSSYADPFHGDREYRAYGGREYRAPRSASSSTYTGRGTAFCVRTCDGRYFPMQPHAGVSPAELCRTFCPASKTMVFSGGKIESAIAHNGARYADLDNAFAYRDKVVDHCTCNGKDALGLARLSSVADPTLRAGDIVATNDGLVNYRGKNSRTAEFTPIDTSSGAWAQKLAEIKVRPAPPSPKIEVAPPADDKQADTRRKDRRRAQFAR